MELVVFTPERSSVDEHEVIFSLFEAGLERLHVRKPEAKFQELKNYLHQFPVRLRSKIVVHGMVGKFKDSGFSKYHLPANCFKDSPATVASEIVSTGVRDFESLVELDKFNFEYVFFSPVFPSISKSGWLPSFTLEKLRGLQDLTSCKLFALGGVTQERLGLVRELGFAGVGILGELWSSANPVKKFEVLQKTCQA